MADTRAPWLLVDTFIAAGPVLVAGAGVFYAIARKRFVAAKHWTETEATVVESWIHVERERHSSGSASTSTTMGSYTSYTYKPLVIYSYQAAGKERRGALPFLNIEIDWSTPEPAQEWLACHVAGTRPPVWYDPANPDNSTLERNPPSFCVIVLMVMIGIVFTLAGLLFRWLDAGPM